jgi:glucose/arabinose dehydrogenase
LSHSFSTPQLSVLALIFCGASLACQRTKEASPGAAVAPSQQQAAAPLSKPPGPTRAAAAAGGLAFANIEMPPGFQIAIYASDVDKARSLALSPNGTLFVGTRDNGKVFAIPNADHDARGDRVVELASGLDSPNGVAFRNGSLYVAEIHRILRFDDVEAKLESHPKPVVVSERLPKDEHHGWKYIAFGPDGLLYVPIGAPCNICDADARGYANLTRMRPDGSGFEIIARGIRNTVGFAWHPTTHELWFTDNGRDELGDDVPGDELNRVTATGQHFGYPYCHAGNILDPEFGKGHRCEEFVAPARVLGPHVAALGMAFYTGTQFPPEYRGQIFIAEHGSWNRRKKSGYRLTLVRLGDGGALSYEPFATGWLRDEKVSGRPVDVLVAPDGALLVSDDEANAIYRITYSG